jgi:uncharacterized membrane protein required for colicin V production
MYNWIIYDAVVVAIIFYTVSKAARQGFAVTIVRFIGYFVSWGVAIAFSPIAARYVFDNFFKQTILDAVSKNITSTANTGIISDEIMKAISAMPKIISATLNVDSQAITSSIGKSVEGTTQNLALYMTDNIFAPASTLILRGIFFFIIFAVVSFIINRICSVLRLVNKIPIVGSVNSFFGGLIGLLEGALILTVVAVAVSLLIRLLPEPRTFFSSEVIDNTIIFKHIYNFDPLKAKQIAMTLAENNPFKQ